MDMDKKNNGKKTRMGRWKGSKVVEGGSTKRKEGFGYGLMVGIIILCVATIIFIKFYELGIGLIVAVDAGILGVCVFVGAVNGILSENEERHLNCIKTVDSLVAEIHKLYNDSTAENNIKISEVKPHYMPDGVSDRILINRENYNIVITKLDNTYNEIRNLEDVMRKSILDNMRESFEYWENEKQYIDIK